jgi:GntR family transcriptional repressor for pyruvate dehydrogenase complex
VDTLRRTALVDLTVAQLTEQLAAGTWPVGTALPAEIRLADTLGVGRSTVREATRALVHAGLLEARQGSGTFVLSTTAPAPWVASLRTAAIVEVYEVREALEVKAAALAAARRTRTDVTALRRALAARVKLLGSRQRDPGGFVEADLAFHRAVVAAGHNALLLQMYDSFASELRDAIVPMIASAVLDDVDADVDTAHRDLFEAIVAGDPEAAVAATQANVDLTIAGISTTPDRR